MTDPVQNPYISTDSNDENAPGGSLTEFVRPGQIITFALVQGVLVIAAVMYFFVMDDPVVPNAAPNAMPAGNGDLVLPGIGIVAAIGACAFSFVITKMLRRTIISKYQSTETNPQKVTSQDVSLTPAMRGLMQGSQTCTLVGQAILEGAAVINAILMIVDNNLIHLGLIAVLVVGIVIQVPTVGKKWALAREATDNR